MAVQTPSDIWIVGTNDSTGETIASNTEYVSSVTDILQAADKTGEVWLGINFTSSTNVGSLDVTLEPQRSSGSAYTAPAITISIPANSARQGIMFGPYPVTRYARVRRKNNGGSSFSDVSVVIMPVVVS